MPKILRIDMTDRNYAYEEVGQEYVLYGGRGFIAKKLNEEVNPKCDPLGQENKLILSLGLLAGTMTPSSGRISIGAKSPLTGTIKESNSGGMAASMLARLGLKAVIIESKPADKQWHILKLGKSGVEFIPADEYLGMNTYQLSEQLKNKFGTEVCVISIGKAGERGYRSASIQITDMEGHPARACGRGGLGSVMASKYIKAIIIEKTDISSIVYRDRERFTKGAKGYAKGLKSHPVSGQIMHAVGTAGNVNLVNELGALPTFNFSSGRFGDAEKISGERLAEIQRGRNGKTGHRCSPGCAVCCSNIYNDANGQYITSGFEYETIALNGSNCGISNLDTIARIDRMCDDLGVDTMETGCTLAVCMESGRISFGDEEGALSLLQEMNDGTEFGNIMGQGTDYTGRQLGVKRIPTVKGQALAAYDPRSLKGTGVTEATCPMGADHTSGNSLGTVGFIDPALKNGQVELSQTMQKEMVMADNMGICIFASFCLADTKVAEDFCEMLAAIYGGVWNWDKLMKMSEETLALEKEFNRKAGFNDSDDKLPDFFYSEPLPPLNTVFDFTPEDLAKVIPY
jgi:aldehyde:ferredoxin oxidoreductase